jgi:hypothetical protein
MIPVVRTIAAKAVRAWARNSVAVAVSPCAVALSGRFGPYETAVDGPCAIEAGLIEVVEPVVTLIPLWLPPPVRLLKPGRKSD